MPLTGEKCCMGWVRKRLMDLREEMDLILSSIGLIGVKSFYGKVGCATRRPISWKDLLFRL